MTLAEWSSLTEGRRRELILQWHQEGRADAYRRLAMEALQILRKELKAVPEVTWVVLGMGEFLSLSWVPPAMVYSLDVCTLQPESFKIDRLPAEIMGFRVRQVNLGDKRDGVVRVWKRLFKEIRGWSEEQTREWAKKYEGWEESPHGFGLVYDKGPVKLAVPYLIDEQTRALLGAPSRESSDLCDEIYSVITEKEPYSTGFPPLVRPGALDNYDWDDVRRKIQELAEKYGQKQK
jgi:hypothetical protein